MKISFHSFKLLLPLLLVAFTERAFWEFFFESADDPFLRNYEFAMLGLGLAGTCWYWRNMEPVVRTCMLLTVAYLLGLMLESYATHGTWMVYMHVFSKLLLLFLIYGAYGFYRRHGLPPLKPLVAILFIGLLLNLAFIHPEALSIQAFLDTERGFSATSALLLVLPALLSLNWYLQRGNALPLGTFFICMALIVFLQHRSVWITTIIALPLNLLLLRRVPGVRFSAHRVVLLVVLPLAIGVVGGLATILENPDVVKKFESNYEDITQADKQGTGSWRLKQMESYQPFVAERPLLGWRLEGFELPMQFYDPSSDEPMWPDGTGHHFHSFYMDRLFYFGWVGLLLVVVLPFVQVIRRLAHPAPLTLDAAALIALVAGCLVFSLSYDWPIYLYALLGLMLAAAAPPAPVAPPLVPEHAPAEEPEPESVFAI